MSIKITSKFTTNTVDYDLLQDATFLNKLTSLIPNYTSQYISTNGITCDISIIVNSATQLKVNNQSFYNDFIKDIVWSSDNSKFYSLKIKDSGISGTISLVVI